MQRNIIRQFRFNKEENEVLKEKAKKCCITDSALVRMLVLGFIPKPKPEKEFYNALRYLSSMSNSLQSLQRQMHSILLMFLNLIRRLKVLKSSKKICMSATSNPTEMMTSGSNEIMEGNEQT